MLLSLSSCSTSFCPYWHSSYKPTQHIFETDSVILTEQYGIKETKDSARSRVAKGMIIDSTPNFYFHLEQKVSWIPIIPILFYFIEFQRPNAPYQLQVRIKNNKIYQSLDSISYIIYDSLETVYYKGSHNYNWDFTKLPYYRVPEEPYNINMKLSKTATIYGDIDLLFTDFNNKPVMLKIKRIKFNYEKGRQWFFIHINS
jgi:hypothetical protein